MRRSGFIAQEVEEAAKESGYIFDGLHVPKNDNEHYSLSYALFVVPLVKAVQELSAQNDSLKNVNDELQTQINNLSKRVDAIETAQKSSNSSIQLSTTNLQSLTINTSAILEQNLPNPFNSNTIIHYSIPQNAVNAKIVVTDMNGSILKNIYLTSTGTGQIQINAGTLASGNYIYSLFIDNQKIQSRQMVLTK